MLRRRFVPVAFATAAIALSFVTMPAAQISWSHARSDNSNDGLLSVTTAPARSASIRIHDIGTFTPGAGPVTGADGTVYIGNQQGTVFAFHADGTKFWRREVKSPINASPVLSSDGSVWVIASQTVMDHRGGQSVPRSVSTLHRFTSSGGWSGPLPFPDHFAWSDAWRQQGLTTAFPSIWKFAGAEALMVPVVYHAFSTTEIRLLAFSMTGLPLGETLVTRWTDQVTSDTGPFDFLFPPFHPGSTAERVSFPGVAILSDGGTPSIVVADHVHDVVGYTFVTDGNTGTFTERFRVHDGADDNGVLGSPPILLADGHSAIGSGDGRLVFAGPNPRPLAAVAGMDPVWFAPTRLVDGRLVLVERRRVFVLQNNAVQARISLPFPSSASAAASFNHFFVATTDRFLTFDASTLSEVASAAWSGGGQWPPVIGPQGHVYAMAGNVLFVFPPPPGPAAIRRSSGVHDSDNEESGRHSCREHVALTNAIGKRMREPVQGSLDPPRRSGTLFASK